MNIVKSLLALTAFYAFPCVAFAPQSTLHAHPGSSLERVISDAKKKHLTAVFSPRMGYTARVPEGLDDALNESLVVIAKFEAKTVTVADDGILTYYTFAVLRQFNTRKKSSQDGFPKRPQVLPPEVAPPGHSELLLSHFGGTAVVDGIAVTTPNAFPVFAAGQTYCLFVQPSPGIEGYSLFLGSSAVYRVDDGLLVPANPGTDNLINADLHARFNAKLSLLQTHLAAMSKGTGH